MAPWQLTLMWHLAALRHHHSRISRITPDTAALCLKERCCSGFFRANSAKGVMITLVVIKVIMTPLACKP